MSDKDPAPAEGPNEEQAQDKAHERPAEEAKGKAQAAHAHAHDHGHAHGSTGALALAALGVVFGDIGTSPLYALKECVVKGHGVDPTHDNVLGLLSLIFWSLMMVVTVKYLTFIMRADNQGEGGILALLALVPEGLRGKPARVGVIAALVVFGAALLYGDGIITPAISVLSAVEGLEVATDKLKPMVVPITCGILLGLFWIQKRGTAGIGKVFGPIMIAWFLSLAGLGVAHIVKNPAVFAAIDPRHAAHFFAHHKFHGFIVLGAVVLSITGGEALYADMGHFGRKPIQIAWYGAVLPALVLNYFGQGAMLLAYDKVPEEVRSNPFFAMVPEGSLKAPLTYMLVALATAATVIASQALISGAYSLTNQAVQLGFFPRVKVEHTSRETEGQIYIPSINWGLAIACLILVLSFKESSKLAAAYGIAVTGTMGITSIVYFVVVTQNPRWGWSKAKAAPLLVLFLAFDLPFFGANALKFFDGGYVPMLVGAALFVAMVTWKRGRALLAELFRTSGKKISAFIGELGESGVTRVDGTAVFLASNAEFAPPVLTRHVKYNKAIHKRVVLLTVTMEHVPEIAIEDAITVDELGPDVHRVVIKNGFMQQPNVPAMIAEAVTCHGLPVELEDGKPKVTYYLGRENILGGPGGQMGVVAESIFGFMTRNAGTAADYFGLPPEQVIELGMQVDL